MTRHKWFRIGLPGTLNQLEKRVRATRLTADRQFGFSLRSAENGEVVTTFLQRSSVPIVLLDGEGNAQRQLINTIDRIDFVFLQSSAGCWIRVDEPPRSLRDMLNALETTAGMGFSAEPVTFSLAQQKAVLARTDEFKLIGLKGVGSSVELQMVARIELASKVGLNLERLEILRDLSCTIDHSSYEASYQRTRGQITFTATGVVRLAGQLQPRLLNLVERQLVQRTRGKV